MGSSCSSANNTPKNDVVPDQKSSQEGSHFSSPVSCAPEAPARSEHNVVPHTKHDGALDLHTTCDGPQQAQGNDTGNGTLSLPNFEPSERADVSSGSSAPSCGLTPKASRGFSRQSTFSRSRPFTSSNTVLGASQPNMTPGINLIDDYVLETSSNSSSCHSRGRKSAHSGGGGGGDPSQPARPVRAISLEMSPQEDEDEEWNCQEFAEQIPTHEERGGPSEPRLATTPKASAFRARLRAMEVQYKLKKDGRAPSSPIKSVECDESHNEDNTTESQYFHVPSILSELQQRRNTTNITTTSENASLRTPTIPSLPDWIGDVDDSGGA